MLAIKMKGQQCDDPCFITMAKKVTMAFADYAMHDRHQRENFAVELQYHPYSRCTTSLGHNRIVENISILATGHQQLLLLLAKFASNQSSFQGLKVQ